MKKLIYGLLALGIVLIGGGLWLRQASMPPKLEFPEGDPVIYEKLEHVMRGQFSYLYIYGDGSVVYVEEKGRRMPAPGHPPTRSWSTGRLTDAELDELLTLFRDGRFIRLDSYIQFPGESIPGGGTREGDGGFTFYIDSEGLEKTVTAYGYLSPDQDATYPDMPAPLNDIYVKLRAVTATLTEVAKENIS